MEKSNDLAASLHTPHARAGASPRTTAVVLATKTLGKKNARASFGMSCLRAAQAARRSQCNLDIGRERCCSPLTALRCGATSGM